ncbi:PRE C2HC domain-containing protein [Aphis craccivora]|uniref:PRE C2HC domain-containing protein n=1 Tax=Aphis craccivora TaxID=307492 RepID=A0A6G0VYA2_APHCR|nr:PRE C2HC domain-containing protein [Aphis craccivora]
MIKKPTDHSNEMFKLESLLHTKIKIEEPQKPKIISQCQKCQAYGHTKAYCGYIPRCVRCSDDHSSSACPNSRQDPMRCALCTDNHPANYRGCTVYKNLQQPKISHPRNTISYNPPSGQSQTYAQATQGQHIKSDIPTPTPDIHSLMSSFIIKANHPNDTAHGGVAIFIKNSIYFQPLPNYCFDYIKSCTIIVKLHNIPITVGAFNSPPRGDYNAEHNAWGCLTNNPCGIILYNFVNTNNFNVLAPPGPTYWPSSPTKKPDILDIFVTKIPTVNNLTMQIQSAAWEATKPNKTHNTKNNYPSVSDQIRCLIVEKRRARAKYQVTRLPSHKTAYNKLTNSVKSSNKKLTYSVTSGKF